MLETPAFSLYNASAGSGKTYTLVKAYLKILFSANTDDAYRKILAITFTNKAVNEMKQRIISSLHAFSLEVVSEKYQSMLSDLVKEMDVDAEWIQQKAKRIIKNIIHNYAGFDISTIDKFTQKVIRSFATDLNLPVNFEVSLESSELLREAVEAVIAKAGHDTMLTNLLIEFSLENTDEDKSWDMTNDLIEMGEIFLNERNAGEVAMFDKAEISDFIALRDELKDRIQKIETFIKAKAVEILDSIKEHNIEEKSFSRQSFPKHIHSIANNTWSSTLKKYQSPEDIQINKTAKDKEVIEALIPGFLENTQLIYKKNGDKMFYEAFLKNITPISLLKNISDEFQKIQDEKNVLPISKFNAIVSSELKNQPAPFIYEKMGEKYRNFFIDEFQDTSELQWNNLIPLIDNALSGQDMQESKGTLLIVGDPKQSIYRWRGGKAEQFISLSKEENPFSNPDKQTLFLDTNYRSYSEVVEFNNRFFNLLSKQFEDPDYQYLYEHESAQRINSKQGGYVQIQLLDKPSDADSEITKTDQYLEATVQKITEVVANGFDYKDIVVLIRKRKDGVALANYLTENNIPIISSETLLIQKSTEVQILIHALRYLKNNEDLESKAMLLYHLGSEKQGEVPVHNFIVQGMEIRDEKAFQDWIRLSDIIIDFDFARKNDLYAATEYLIKNLIGKQNINSYVQYFLDVVLERSVKYQSSIADFLQYWEQKYEKLSIPSPENENAVRIMTIHTSKGLEFPVVIFSFADEDYSRSRDKIWVDTKEFTDFNVSKALVNAKKDVLEYGAVAKEVYEKKKQEDLLDNSNVLYVALTRAEEQLYIISYRNTNKSGELPNNLSSSFIRFLQEEQKYEDEVSIFEFGSQERISKPSDDLIDFESLMITSPDNVITHDEIKISKGEAMLWGSRKQEAIDYGNILHELLAQIYHKEEVATVLETAVRNGNILRTYKDTLFDLMNRIISQPELDIFFNDKGHVYSERMILKKGKHNSKPDRVKIIGQDAYVLDYKTGEEKASHHTQLLEYAELLEEMGYMVRQKSLVYLAEDELKIINL